MESLKQITRDDIEAMDRVPRLKLVNALPGFKSANLVGTVSGDGTENLAIFSSVIHLGSDPPLLGCIIRPRTVARHTYDNLTATGWYTVNQVHAEIVEKAHRTSGNYREEFSEFEICGLTPWYSEACTAPYVREARIRIGLKPVEEHRIETNGTILLAGSVEEVWLPESILREDGAADIEAAGTVTISGLENYHTTERLSRHGYVRVDEELRRID
ncbi:MAG: flavin reductase [Balneolaceae bacterium]|nr:flavin reductase [Balneolaceae bacterium]